MIPTGAVVPALIGDEAALLARWWMRPVPAVVASWRDAPPARRPNPSGVDDLLDEYERLFVGPGIVPCCPYESFWQEDVAIDLRRSLMGPCTASLRSLYAELGLEVDPATAELPDHIAVELEALAVALASGREDLARSLYSEHLLRFVSRLCRAVGREASLPFYRELAALTLNWVGSWGTLG